MTKIALEKSLEKLSGLLAFAFAGAGIAIAYCILLRDYGYLSLPCTATCDADRLVVAGWSLDVYLAPTALLLWLASISARYFNATRILNVTTLLLISGSLILMATQIIQGALCPWCIIHGIVAITGGGLMRYRAERKTGWLIVLLPVFIGSVGVRSLIDYARNLPAGDPKILMQIDANILVPPGRLPIGGKQPVKAVLFVDFGCASCRALLRRALTHEGKLVHAGILLRHWPHGHNAFAKEVAQEFERIRNGKNDIQLLHQIIDHPLQREIDVAKLANLSDENNTNGSTNVADDLSLARRLNLRFTPAAILMNKVRYDQPEMVLPK